MSNFTAKVSPPAPAGKGVTIDDFVSFMPTHNYIYVPCRQSWPASSVNARLKRMPVLNKSGKPRLDSSGKPMSIPASTWLDRNRPVEQISWCPGEPTLIRDRLVVEGAIIERKGVTTFNLYRPPLIELGDASKAGPWIDHVYMVFKDDGEHTIQWLAHRVQRPQEHLNHGLVLGGEMQGTGKDTLLEPVRYAIGPWNFGDIPPAQFLGRFNSFAKSVILRINEARDQGEVDRFKFYDHSKSIITTPPTTVRMDEKHQREYYIPNCIGLIITSNHRDSVYLPAEDRRYFVAWSSMHMRDFPPGYWKKIWRWYESEGGYGHVAAYLTELDLSDFDPKAPPPKTAAFWDIVNINSAPEDTELTDVIDKMGNPDALTLSQVMANAGPAADWLMEKKNFRALKHRLGRCKYVSVKNPDREDGRWKIKGSPETVYAKSSLSPQGREEAARRLSEG